jgi:hypothetical protein
MASTAGGSGTIIALVDEQRDLEYVRLAAIDMVEGSQGSRLILFDASGASEVGERSDPDEGALFSAEDLERLGRPEIARQVRDARARGIDAWGSLVSEPGIEPMMAFARAQRADVVLLPEDLGDPIVLERLLGDAPVDAEVSASVSVLVVPREAPQV